ncbi:hypothetical protein OG365_11470 [Streptomyces sp. NBC_00853]|uniref:hypothetical protein n=1 Tax=Streptomyces sp. NBC_00853 TaxID=2903681 RepID=UPI0038734804|nr:hypothetical protein OG365_11470 [Streptomyces sp. NBC_00853]
MKDLPPGLPPADSRKWHGRRWWDPLGYLRVRSLANPHWSRDMPWLIARLRRERSAALPADRDLYDEAIAAAQGYARTRRQTPEAERAWDRLLAPIDELLTRRQTRHLDAVHEARAGQDDARR